MFSKFYLLVLLAIVHSFQIPQHVLVNTHRSFTSLRVFSPSEAFDSPSLTLSLVDSIPFVDPVVVSGAFWSVLRGKVISVLIGNLLATIFLFVVGKVVIDVVFKGGGLNEIPFVGQFFPASEAQEKPAPPTTKQRSKTLSNVKIDVPKLFLSLAIDFLGDASMALPFFGGFTDLATAPLEALALRKLYGSNTIAGLEFAKEVLPFDIIPLATICFVIETWYGDSLAAEKLSLGQFSDCINVDVDKE